ncbi:MAG: SMI1/KNR4 family protein [Planctomycetales bacterium]
MNEQLSAAIRKLRELNEPVPKPMRLPSPEEVDEAERELGIQFHPDYRHYLLEASDVVLGILEPATLTVPDDFTDLREVCKSAWESYDVPRNLLPICEDNADFYCLNARGEVLFWSHNGLSEEKWPTLADWIEQVWIAESEEE